MAIANNPNWDVLVGMARAQQNVATQVMQPPDPAYRFSFEEMLAMRMRWPRDVYVTVGYRVRIEKSNDKVLVWVIMDNGEYVVLEDDEAMFPSDALVAKLKLMEKNSAT